MSLRQTTPFQPDNHGLGYREGGGRDTVGDPWVHPAERSCKINENDHQFYFSDDAFM